MTTNATRSLITFAFVKDEFDKTGDLVQGLVPLFSPIFEKLEGQPFSPAAFSAAVQEFYGLKIHPWVAEDWAPRFEQAGFLVGSGDKYTRTYVCAKSEKVGSTNADEVTHVLALLVEHVEERLAEHKVEISRTDIEDGIIDRLKKPDFLNLLLKPNLPRGVGRTLSLPGTTADSTVDKEGILDFVLASRILELSETNPPQFAIVSRIAAGALVSEIVLNLRNPPKVGQKIAPGSIIYLDSPFLIDVLDLGDRQQHLYAADLVKDLLSAGAVLRTYDHNLDEIQGILVATLDNHNDVNSAVGTVAYRIRTDGSARTRAQAVRSNLRKKLQALSVTAVDMSTSTSGKEKFFSDEHVLDLTSQIRPFGDIFSREIDAWSIAGVARHVLSVKAVSNVMSLPAVFITKNAGLARKANKFLSEQCNYNPDAASPFLTDRQAAGLMWLALGGAAGNLPERQLLANCASAVTPRRDVISSVFRLLEETDAKAAQEFEVLMSEDRCAHYVMESALGDASLVTADNALEILEQVKRRAIEDVAKEYDEKREQELSEERDRNAATVSRIESEYAKQISDIVKAADHQAAELAREIQARDAALEATNSKLSKSEAEISEQASIIVTTQTAVTDLQKVVLLRCVRVARNYGRNLKAVIAFTVAILISAVAPITSFLMGRVESGAAAAMLIGASLVLTALLTTLITWVVPDWVFSWLTPKIVRKRFDRAVQSEGADVFLSDWKVDLENGSVELKKARTLKD